MENKERNPFRRYLILSRLSADRRAQESIIRRQQETEEYLEYLNNIKKEREERLKKIAEEREGAVEEQTTAPESKNVDIVESENIETPKQEVEGGVTTENKESNKSENKEKSGNFALELMRQIAERRLMSDKLPTGILNSKVSDMVSYSAEEQRDFFTKGVLAQASEIYDAKINQLLQQIDLEAQLGIQRTSAANLGFASKEDMLLNSFVGNVNNQTNIERLLFELNKIKKEKDSYIQAGLNMSDPYKLFSGQLNSIATASDDFLKLRASEEQLRVLATNLKNTPRYTRDNDLYKKAVADYFSAKIQSDDLAEKYTKFIDYLNVLGYLPKTLDEIPAQYKDAAKSMFTKNGEFLLENKEFRDDFNTRNIVEKDQLSNITKLAKDVVSKEARLDSDYISQKKDELDLLEAQQLFVHFEGRNSHSNVWGNRRNDGDYLNQKRNLNSARRILEKAELHQKLNDEVLKNRDSFDAGIKNFLVAGREFFTSPNTYTFRAIDAVDNVNTYRAAKKLNAGEELSAPEKTLLQANLIENAFKQQYGDYLYVNSYKWSNIAMESLQFMAEFIATAGVGAALERGAAKQVFKHGGKKMLKNVATATKALEGTATGELDASILSKYALNTVAKYGNSAGYKLYLAAGRLGADATYATFLANTLGLPRTISDAAQNATGIVDGGFDINGNPYVDGTKEQENITKAVFRSETRNFIENFSEMMGEWGIGSALKKTSKLVGLSNFMNRLDMAYKRDMVKEIMKISENYLKHGTSEINAVLRKTGLGKFIPRMNLVFNQRVLKAGRFNGFAGEVSEEYYGLILQHLLGVQDDPNKTLWDDVKGQTADIFGGIAVSTALLGAIGMASSIRSEMKYDNAVRNLHNLFGDETAYEIQKSLTFAHPVDFYNTLDRIMDVYGEGEERSTLQKIKDTFSKDSSLDRKTALAEYARALFELRGAVYGEEVVSKMLDRNTRVLVRDAKKNGYRIANYRTLNTMNNVVKILENDANSSVSEEGGAKGVIDKHDGNITKVIDAIKSGEVKLAEGETKESAVEKFMAYVNALNFREGIDLGLHDMANERAQKRASLAFKLVNKNASVEEGGGAKGVIRVLHRPRLKEDGTETEDKEVLYWIDGELKTLFGEDTIDSTEKLYKSDDDGKILVADRTGQYKYIDRAELEKGGWHVSPQSELLDALDVYNQLYLDEVENQWNVREQYLSELGENPQTGDEIYIGNKVLTILDANPRYGITYSLSDDENGKNSKIYHAEDVSSLKQFIDSAKDEQFKEITDYFKQFAKDEASRDTEPDRVVRLARAAAATRQRILKSREQRAKKKLEEADRKRFDKEISRADVSDEMTEEEIERRKQEIIDRKRLDKEIERQDSSDEIDIAPGSTLPNYQAPDPLLEYEIQRKKLSDEKRQALEDSLVDYAEAGQKADEEAEATAEQERQRKILEEIAKANAEEERRRKLIDDEERRRLAEQGAPSEEVSKLVKEIGISNDNKIATTGYHYIIKVGRRHRLMKRVHSIIGDRRDNSEETKNRKEKATEYKNRLLGAKDLFGEVEKILNEIYQKESKDQDERVFIKNEWVNVATLYKSARIANLNLEAYKKYVKQHPDEKGEVIEGISDILSRTPQQTVLPGNVYDTISRYYLDFGTSELKYDDPNLTTSVYGVPTHISKLLKYKDRDGNITERPLVTEEAFNAICKELQKIKDYFDAIGWKLVCRNGYTLAAEVLVDSKKQWVAGETDCIAVDSQGRRHLIDFKTYFAKSKTFFDRVDTAIPTFTEFFNRYTKSEVKDEFTTVDGENVMLYSNAVQYARQLAAYKILAASNGFYFADAFAMLFGIDYEFIASVYTSIDESNIDESNVDESNDPDNGAKNVSNSDIVIKDLKGNEIPNLVNLDNTADQDSDVKLWVSELEKRVQVIESDEVAQLKQLLDTAEIEINGDSEQALLNSTKELVKQYNEDIANLKQKLLNNPKSVTNQMIQNYLVLKSQLQDEINNDIDEYNRKQTEKEEIINAINALDISYDSVEDGLYHQFINTVGTLFSLSDGNIGKIKKEDIEEEELAELSSEYVYLGIWIKLASIVSPDSEKLSNAIKHFEWALLNLFNAEERENILTAIQDNNFSGNKDGINEALLKREWYEITQLISSADSYAGKNMNSSIGSKGTRLIDVTNNHNFIRDAKFYVQRSPEHANDKKPLFEIVIVYNGEEFSPVALNIAHSEVNGLREYPQEAKTLYNKLCNLTERDKTARIKLNNSALSRTPGRIKRTDGLQKLNLDFFKEFIGTKIVSWSDIMYAKDQVDFGLTKKQTINGIPYVVVTVPGYSSGTRSQVYIYTGKHNGTKPPVGGVVFLYRPNYDEADPKNKEQFTQECVPVNLISPNFDKNSAQLILDILSGEHADTEEGDEILDFLSKLFVQNKGKKNQLRLPLTNGEVLKLFISFGKLYREGRKLPISLNVEEDGKVTISGLFNFNDSVTSNDGAPQMYSRSYDIKNSEKDRNDFLNFLQDHVRMQINDEVLSDTFNNISHTIPTIEEIKEWFKNNPEEKELRVGDVVLFDREDLEDGKEVTGLAWYIKHGRLVSDFNGMENPLISIDEENAIDTTPEPINDNNSSESTSVPQESQPSVTIDDIDDLLSGIFKPDADHNNDSKPDYVPTGEKMDTGKLESTTDSEMQTADSSIDEEEARQRIKDILGDIYVPEFSDEVLGSIGNAQIVGACYSYMIQLSRKARRGTEYHEAFHKVLELLIPDKQRERAYRAYRKKFGNDLSDIEVAEKAADEFWWYKENKPNRFKFELSIKNMFDQAKRWYRFYTQIGSFTLWRLYRSAANGKYKNCKPTAEALARWERLTNNKGYLASAYEIDGMKFDHILNSEEYRAVCNTIAMIVLDRRTYANEETGCPFDITGKDLSSMKISPDLIRKSPRVDEIMRDANISKEAKLKLIEMLGWVKLNGKIKTVDDNIEKVLKDVIKDLKQYLMSGSVPKVKEKPKKSSGKTRIEKILSADDIDEMLNTENREMGEYQKISANFEPITRATPRVKYFFSVIEDSERIPVVKKDGQISYKYVPKLNSAGLPQYMDAKKAWSFMLNRIHDCRSQRDLYERLFQLQKQDLRFVPLFNKYDELLKLAYKVDPKTGSVFNPDGTLREVKDVDKEGLVIEITSAINHAKNIPGTMLHMKNSKDQDKYGSTRLINASMQYMSRDFRQNWSDIIASGENEYIGRDKNGRFILREGAAEKISALANWFTLFTNLFSPKEQYRSSKTLKVVLIQIRKEIESSDEISVSTYTGTEIDLDDAALLYELKKVFIRKLNSLGIDVTVRDLDYILESQYGNTELNGMRNFFNEYGEHINGGFKKIILSLKDLQYNPKLGKNQSPEFIRMNKILPVIWTNTNNNGVTWNKFLDVLSVGKYDRLSQESQTRYLTVAGNSQYAMAELNFITDRIFYLTQLRSTLRDLMVNDPYYGSSRFLQFCANHASARDQKSLGFSFIPVPGLKTDAVGSEGVEYLSLSEQEDIICKYGMLATNQIILPTLSDKTTYGGIQGVSKFGAFGIDYTKPADAEFIGQLRMFLGKTNYVSQSSTSISLKFNESILDLFIKYARSEYESAKRELARIKYEEKHRGNEFSSVLNLDNGREVTIKKKIGDKQVEETHIVHQGARLATFTGIIDEDGNFISFNKLYNNDGSYCSEAENLDNAARLFFELRDASGNIDIPEQRRIMARILSRLVQKELEYLQSKGMITLENGLWKNNDLDRVKMQRILWAMSDADASSKPSYLDLGQLHNDALIAYVADMVCKQQMSMLESFRIFSVDPRAFNWEYSEQGFLIDSTKDLFKRLGGLVSTGTHNVEDVSGMNKDVVCAEMRDTKYTSELFGLFNEIALRQELTKRIKDILFSMNMGLPLGGNAAQLDPITIDNEATYKLRVEQISAKLENLSIDQLKNELVKTLVLLRSVELNKDGVSVSNQVGEIIRKEAEEMVKSLEFTINKQNESFERLNTTDGATFITDDFCEELLHIIGKWDKDIAEAFRILREADSNEKSFTNEEIRNVATAYNKIYTTVIGTQKYTGYGHRTQKAKYEDENGQIKEYDRLITFYDKTAYFPIFNCMASGHMKAVLKKMKEQGVLVLKTTSAIKVGGADAVDCNDDTFESWGSDEDAYSNFKFKTYTQPLNTIRKLFNTDPKGKELMPLGTQYVKVILSLIQTGQTYDINGEEISAYDVRERIMEAINKIALAGHKEHMQRFYTDGRLDLEKFLGILKRQLEDKDANDPLLKALKIETYTVMKEVEDPNTKEKTVVAEKRKRFHLPLSAMSSTQWIESIVTSVVNKELVDINTPGQAFYQRPAWGMEGKMKMNYINEDDWEYTINHGEKLKEVNENGSMDCVLSIDFFDYLFEQHPGLRNQSFLAKKDWLIRHGIISGFIKEEDRWRFDESELEDIDGKTWHHAQANIVGYRIPTQAVSSIHAMRCVDVICATRDTIILPREITAVTGSDFDIDKFFLSTLYYKYQYQKDSEEKRKEIFEEVSLIANAVYEHGITTEDELDDVIKIAERNKDEDLLNKLKPFKKLLHELWVRGYLDSDYNDDVDGYEHNANNLLKMQISLLRTTGNNISLLHGSIDVDTIPLKRIAKKIDAKNPHDALDPFDMTSMRSNVTAKMSFAIGKEGIGPYALNNNNHVFTMLYGVKFVHQKDGILDILGLENLGRRTDRNGHPILSWLSGLINAHVDVAKDPYIRSLGVNKYTYNLVSLLIRTGYGEETFWFTTQPIMNKFYDAYDRASGVYGLDENRSVYSRTTEEIDKVFVNFINDKFGKLFGGGENATLSNYRKTVTEQFKEYLYKTRSIDINTAIKMVMKYKAGIKVLEEISCSKESDLSDDKMYDLGSGIKLSYSEILAVVAIAQFELLEKAAQLSKLVLYTKIDTKKQGTTISEQEAYMKNFEQLLDENASAFEYSSVKRMIGDEGIVSSSFINLKTKLAIEATRELMSAQLILATRGYSELEYKIRDILNIDRVDDSVNTSIMKMIIGKIKADYFFTGPNSYCIKRGIVPEGLMVGGLSIYRLLMAIKAGIANPNDHRFDSIRDKNTGLCNNYLINSLISHRVNNKETMIEDAQYNVSALPFFDDWQDAQFVRLLSFTEDAIKSTSITDAWNDLLNDSQSQELRSFAEQLVVYAYMTSAASGGKYDLSRFVPVSWATGECLQLRNVMDYESDSFASYISQVLEKLNSDTESERDLGWTNDEISEMILNFSWNSDIVPILKNVDNTEAFYRTPTQIDGGNPLIFGAIRGTRTIYEQDKHPTFIKIRTTQDTLSGQGKYDIYECVALALMTDGKNSYVYPIYALVAPSGGTYGGGQRIFSIGVLGTAINRTIDAESREKANRYKTFRDYWKNSIPWLLGIIPQSDLMNSPKELMNLLLYMMTSSDSAEAQRIKQQLDDSNGIGYKNTLLRLAADAIEYAKATDTLMFDSYQDYLLKNALSTDEKRKRINYYEESTFLNLLDREPEQTEEGTNYYSKMGDEEGEAIFGKEKVDAIRRNKLHVEFYKLHHDINGKKFYNPVMTVSIIGQKNKGFFQLNADVDIDTKKLNGEYSVHFKTYTLKMKKDTKWASVQMSKSNKSLLMRMIILAIPEGGKLSTWGTVSEGGINALDNLYKYVDENTGYIYKVGFRKLTHKKTGQEVDVPIWEKLDKYAGLYKRDGGYNPNSNPGDEKFPDSMDEETPSGKPYTDYLNYVNQQLIDYLAEFRNKYPSSSRPINSIYVEKLLDLAKLDAGLRSSIVSIPAGEAENYPFGNALKEVLISLLMEDAKKSSDPCI